MINIDIDNKKLQTDGENYWIAPNATIIGEVVLKKDASVWFNAVLRADNEPIFVGEGSNVQDGAIIHTDPGYACSIGKNVTVGHMAMLHGCEVGDGSLIGIGSVVLNGAKIGKNCIIGSKALVTEGMDIPDGSMVLGIPGKITKTLTDEETLEEELESGKIYASQLLGAVKLYENEEVTKYVNEIGRHIANHTGRPDLPWTFAVLDTEGINAFAAPGGYIFLTKGLMSILSTEDELAAVIGHEIAHVIKKHHYNVIKKQKMIQFGTEAISSAADNQIIGKLSNMMGQIMARGLDKESEYEADIDGMVISARSGYDASSLMSV